MCHRNTGKAASQILWLRPFWAVLLGRKLQDNELSQVWRPQKKQKNEVWWRSMVSLCFVDAGGNWAKQPVLDTHRRSSSAPQMNCATLALFFTTDMHRFGTENIKKVWISLDVIKKSRWYIMSYVQDELEDPTVVMPTSTERVWERPMTFVAAPPLPTLQK